MEGHQPEKKILGKYQRYILLACVVCFLAAIATDWYLQRSVNLELYANKIETHLHQQEAQVEAIFSDKTLIRSLLQPKRYMDQEQQQAAFKRLEALASEDYSLLIYLKDSLLFWSNNQVEPSIEDFSSHPGRTTKLVHLKNGYYEQIEYPYLVKGKGTYTLIGLIPIKFDYELTSSYLQNVYTADASIPAEVDLSNNVSSYPIVNSYDQHIGFLHASGPIVDINGQQKLLWLYLIAFLILGVFINSLARSLATPKQAWIGAAFLMASVFGIRLLSIMLGFTDKFSMLPLFTKNFDTPLSSSLGDLLINIILLLWVMIFFHKEAKMRSFDHLSKNVKFGLTTLNYFSILLGILIITSVFKALVFNTGITFDFDNVFNLDRYSLMAITGVILLLIALFLFGHRMMLAILEIGLDRYLRLAALALATLAVAPLLMGAQLMLPTAYLLLIAFVFILIFDLFIDSKSANFTWLVIWLVILSAFPSILLFKYNAYRDRILRISYAKQLSDPRDTIAENALKELIQKIQSDEELPNTISKPYPFLLKAKALDAQINRFFTQNHYLYNNYKLKVFGYNKYEQPIVEGQGEPLSLFEDKFTISKEIDSKVLRLYSDQDPIYFADLGLMSRSNPDNPTRLILQFDRNRKDQSRVYTELLVEQPYKQLVELDKYDYAIYQDGQLIDSKGGMYGQSLNISPLPEVNRSREILIGKRSELVCQVAENKTVVIGKEKEMFIKAISLFSYIFGMLVLLILIFAAINTFVHILPKALSFSLKRRPSLRNRIQLSVIFLIVTSFFIIGMVTVWFFNTSSEDYHEKRLERKTSAVLRNAIHDVGTRSENDSTFQITQLVAPLTRIHRIDINMYDTAGNLISTSEDDIYNKGIITPKMDPLAYRALHLMDDSEYVNDRERVGELIYKSAYVPLKVRTESGEKTLAYLGLPYYSKRSNQRDDVTIFMSTLLNVYVFLLLIAGAIAIAVANSITRPLAKIGDKLKQVKLGKRNEKLEWKSQDELGELIAEYNRMINKLEESADRLAQSEREGAWREMAKQVAHEIKNPLTPMKLSIQYLQHAYKSNPDDIEPLMKRVSGTLIEQIDNLAQIASEFSNFAKMPRAENQKILLNQLVQSVFDLFSNEQYDMEDLQLNISLPDEQYFVYADKNHLMRVLNNLIKNAIQAIPDERSGAVKVFLYRRDNQAIIRVSDNGSGIPEDKRDKVFVPNFTTKNSGTGLGLAISKNIIESVNGEIFFETIVDVGTDFYVILPLVEVTQLVGT